ncbi:MAG: hypothetical protein SH857_18675 [Chitinophagales bacterium]|nr:hypothetical protein [Chitinophagales bacterium]
MNSSAATGILSVFMISLLLSCNSSNTTTQEPAETKTTETPSTPMNELAEFRFTYTIANLPPPMQVLDEFSKSGLPVNMSLLNSKSPENYQSSNKKAFNYGIYGIDLAYSVFNDRTPEILKYYSTVKTMAEELDIAEPFNKFSSKFQENQGNRDSLTRMVDEVYNATDSYLRSNERLMTASVILAGSWLEAQHITVNLLLNVNRTAENDALFQRVWEQRLYLENVAKILESFPQDEELTKIKNDYSNLLLIYKEPTDSNGITQEFLTKLAKNIREVRSRIIS